MERAESIMKYSAVTATFPNLNIGSMEPFRELYRRYVPLIRILSEAGWEPITQAMAPDSQRTETDSDYHTPPPILVERFGNAEAGNLHFTMYNSSDQSANGALEIDASSLGLKRAIRWRERISGAEGKTDFENGTCRIPYALKPDELAVFEIREASPERQ